MEIKPAWVELATPVAGELRREPIANADVVCSRCGARRWLLVERRAEPQEPVTRWRAFACASCGGGDGWESAELTAARRVEPPRAGDDVPGLPDIPTVDDVVGLASFRVLAPSSSAELGGYSFMAGRPTGVKLTYAGVEVLTEIRAANLSSRSVEPPSERGARFRLSGLVLAELVDAARREPRSEPAQALHMAAALRQAEARAAAAQPRDTIIDVDGAPVGFTLVGLEGCWAAGASVGDELVTVASREVPVSEVALRTVSHD